MLDIKTGEKVLDIGAGIGGNAFQMAQLYGAHVRGIDLATNMVAIANERATMKNIKNVEFAVEDMTKSDYPPNSFDIIYSRCGLNHDF